MFASAPRGGAAPPAAGCTTVEDVVSALQRYRKCSNQADHLRPVGQPRSGKSAPAPGRSVRDLRLRVMNLRLFTRPLHIFENEVASKQNPKAPNVGVYADQEIAASTLTPLLATVLERPVQGRSLSERRRDGTVPHPGRVRRVVFAVSGANRVGGDRGAGRLPDGRDLRARVSGACQTTPETLRSRWPAAGHPCERGWPWGGSNRCAVGEHSGPCQHRVVVLSGRVDGSRAKNGRTGARRAASTGDATRACGLLGNSVGAAPFAGDTGVGGERRGGRLSPEAPVSDRADEPGRSRQPTSRRLIG